MNRRQTTIITALSVVAFFLTLMVSGRLWFRLDLTRSRAYTISSVSRNLYTEIPDYISITYYLSSKLRSVISAPGEIEDTLREYAAFSKGKIRVTVRDPLKANLITEVEELGLQPRQVETVAQDQSSLVTVYSGIVIEYLDKIEVLPWVISIDMLEYDLTSRIRSMVNDVERRIGIIVGDSFRQWREDFSYLDQMLSESGYKARLISPGDEIPDNLPAIFVLGGVEDLDNWALYRIDRYIQQGGRALFAVKGVYIDTLRGSIEARHQEDKGLLQMIASYGVIVRPELALDRNALTLQYQTRMPSGAVQYRIVRYPLWIGVMQDNGNPQHPVSANFSGVDLYWPSPLELAPPENVQADYLFTSSPEAWIMRNEFYTSPEMPYLLEKSAAETRGKKNLGASLTGEFPSFFRGSPKPVREGSGETLPDMPQYPAQSRIIVIGDTDFATNIINATKARQNLDFLMRSADWLVSDDDIIGIRSKQPHIGRLDKILDPGRRSAAIRFVQIVNVGLIPLLVIAGGLFLASRRRKRSRGAEG
ncbi:MAG: GldG family protein [Treponema sp.]|jgi:gliding-associated putative ABC transporter substrate-binding component GldG|nr:GldG family protein [Treponema sp.]